ncbi:MAG: ABC transporter ATP-binding protein [Methylibium sp. NZG]|nr:MAG: ABC transporter ATP-binding protein [Methylibium sp. NZG]
MELRDVCIRLPGRSLIEGLSITVPPGEVLTVMGASGSGKSSLLAFIGGFLNAPFSATGEVVLAGRHLAGMPAHERRVGILFQDDLLFPHLSVAGNLMFGLPASVTGRAARLQTVEQALIDTDLAGFATRDPATLSGGQRARVALLRTLLSQPQALLLDEPFGKLDAALRDDFRRFVFGFARHAGVPTVLVTHDAADAAAAGGPVVSLD